MFLLQGKVEGLQDSGGTGAPLELCGFDVTDFSKQTPVVWSAGKNRKLGAAGFWFQKSSAIIKLFSTLNIRGTSALKGNPSYIKSMVIGLVWFGGILILPLQIFLKPLRFDLF